MIRQPAPELLQRALVRHRFADTTDGALLGRYAKGSDQEAFAELVRRYAGLVWSACRHACSDDHLAEDAFQNTFILLARQAHSIRRVESLPAWLHRVARRTAGKIRRQSSGQSAIAIQDVESISPSPSEVVGGSELVRIVEAEVEQLPEKYRSVLLMCWFDDESLDSAATRLGITKGTLWGRLKRGRDRLRQRLEKRGIGLPAVLGTMVVTATTAPAGLATRTAEMVVREAASRVVSSASSVGSFSWVLAKAGGGIAMAAAVLIAVVTLMPASEQPAPEKRAAEPIAQDSQVDDGFPFPKGAIHRFGNRQLRHPDGIRESAISPDGKLLATASPDAIVIWDLKTLSAKRVFTNIQMKSFDHAGRTGQIAFLADSKSFVVTVRLPERYESNAELAQVWDIETGKMRYALKGMAQQHYVSAWPTAKGKELALVSLGEKGTYLRHFDAKDGKEIRSMRVEDLQTLPWIAPGGGTMVVPGARGVGVKVFETNSGKEVFDLPTIKPVQFAPSRDGKLLATVGADGTVHVHDMKARKELFSFEHPEKDRPGPMIIGDDNSTLYFASNHGRLFRWNLKENKPGPEFGNRHNFWNISTIALSPDESMLYSTSLDRLIKRWDLKTGDEIKPPVGYTTQTTSVMSADGKQLILTDHEGQVDVWDLASGRMEKQVQPSHLGGINCLARSNDGRWLAGGRTSQDIRLFDLSTGKSVGDFPLGDNSDSKWGDPVLRLAFGADGKILYSSSAKTGLSAWEIPSGKRLWNIPSAGNFLAIDPKGRWLAASGGQRQPPITWTLFNARTGVEIGRGEVEMLPKVDPQRLASYHPVVSDLAFTSDGSRLMTAHYDGQVREWDPETRKLIRTIGTHRTGGQAYLDCSPSGQWLAVGAWDRSVTLWELSSGKKVLSLDGHHSHVTQVAFTRDGTKLVSHADLSPILWSLAPGSIPRIEEAGDSHWEALSSDDAEKAYQMQWALAQKPLLAVKLFKERIKPAELCIEFESFEKWAKALDHPQFRIREASEKSLRSKGTMLPIAWLHKALAESKSDEQRTRLERVLAARQKLADPNEWRTRRAVTILELSKNPQARELLEAWSKAAPGSPLSDQAKGALSRMR